uniref:Putative calcineurin-like phosphoesterase n=1 Tax=viral metagenome TaxID=1070528 RepID=A0A6H2A3N1_9ZZZZ
MDAALINNWNSRVGKNDIVIFLGDFMFKQKHKIQSYLEQLKGNITFIKGNHDHNNSLNTRIIYLVLNMGEQDIFCIHNPRDYSNAYSINLTAHVHEKWKIRQIYNTFLVNVGVDVWNYHPVDFNEILKLIARYKRMNKREKRIVEGLETYKLLKSKIEANPPKKLEN